MKVEKFSDPAREKIEARLQKIDLVIGQRKKLAKHLGTGEIKKDSSWEYTLWLGQKVKEGKKEKVVHAAEAVGRSVDLLTGRRTQAEAELKKHDSIIRPELIEFRMRQLKQIEKLYRGGIIPSEVYGAKIGEMQALLTAFKHQLGDDDPNVPPQPPKSRYRLTRRNLKNIFSAGSTGPAAPENPGGKPLEEKNRQEPVVVAFKPRSTQLVVYENPDVKTGSPPAILGIPHSGNGEVQSGRGMAMTATEAKCLRLVRERGTGLIALRSIVKETGLGSIAKLRQLFNKPDLQEVLLEEFQQARISRRYIAQNHR